MDRLRILYLIHNLGYGGAETALANLINELDPVDFDVWIGGLFGLGPIRKRISLPDDRYLSLGFHRKFYHVSLPAFVRLFRAIRKHRIQIVHTHLPQANTLGRLVAWLAGVPVILATEHNTYLQKSRRAIFADHLLFSVTTQMIAVSNAVRLFASRQARIPEERFLVIPNGIPLPQIPILSEQDRETKRKNLGIDGTQPVVLSVGRLTPQKGLSDLIKAAPMILDIQPDVLFLIAGGGPLEGALRAQVQRNGLGNRVRFLGFRSDIYELLQISTLFALPSRWEGLCVALLEACAYSVPVVASEIGGIPEVIAHGRNGFLVPPADPDALARAILTLLDSPELRNRMGKEGRKTIKTRFSSAMVAKQISEVYQQLWSEQKARHQSKRT